ncbi:MAG: hypothetical protein KUG68_05720, partial [Flavobacteriaceae bacterium]|nr:hypothetical protein [Flavobacteriaceae bacterium]
MQNPSTPQKAIVLNMKSLLFLMTFLCLISFSFTGFSQKAEVNKPFLASHTSSMRYVAPLDSKQTLIPYEYVEKEAKDGRSREYEYCEGTGTFGDDILSLNPKPLNETRQGRAPSLVFDAYTAGGSPTDPSGAVGPNHYFTVFNTGFIIYDKSGNPLTGQLAVTNIFSSGGCCDLTVSYDNAADRWVVSYLFSSGGAEIAVSDGPNPVTAGWNVYTIPQIADYQKLSVWSDGYYITENTGSANKIYALERDEMLLGNPAAQILGFQLPGIVTNGFFSPQAFNVSNSDLPATGSLPIVYMYDNNWGGGGSDHIKLWEVDVDWVTTSNSGISATPQQIPVAAFNSLFDNGSFSNLAQPSGGVLIDALQATIMNQAQFRKFAGHNSAVFNFVVDVDGGSAKQAGVRWMEFRQNGDGLPWSLFQEGTYTAADNKHAWNASLAMDDQGNIGMGYTGMSSPNSSNGNVRVSSYYTGRLSGDTAGTMTIAEETIAIGNGLFTNERYGDYSKIDVDPSDDQTFWFIDEYINGSRKGVVGVFKIASLPAGALVSFDNASGNVDEGFGNDCFVDLNVPLSISQAPTDDADVTFNIDGGSTTTTGLDFELLTPTLTFPSGLTGSQNMVLRIYHDGLVEIDETLIIDFTVDGNTGDGAANTLADSFDLTISSTDIITSPTSNVTLYDEDFEDGSFDGTTTGNAGSDFWSTGNAAAATSSFWTTTGNLTQFGFTNDDACNCDKGNDLLTTTAFSLVGSYTSATLTFDHAFSDVSPEIGDVLISTGGAFSSVQALSNTSTGGSAKTTPWVNGISIDMTPYIGQANVRVRFRYNDGAGWLYGMAVDNILVTASFDTQVQTAVNPATSYNSNINGLGSIYNSDVATGNAMCDITNNDAHDYGCTDVWVSRAGTGAQTYNGSSSPDLVMDKTFTIQPTNEASPGDATITFYFTEAEIAGWEFAIGGAPAVGVARVNLVAGRENSGTLDETSPLIIGAFGTDVTLTGTFTGLADSFYFGPNEAFIVPCSGVTKTWNGAWNPSGDPDRSNPVIISAAYNTTTHGNITACSIDIESG